MTATSFRRRQCASSLAVTGANPNYRVLSEVFGSAAVSHALRGRDPDNDEETFSDMSLDLAIGILRTLLNEKKATPDDIRRVTRRWRTVVHQRRREQTAHSAPDGTGPNYRVLSEIFGDVPVSGALFGREQACAPTPGATDDGDAPSDDEEWKLDLAIGILRTLLNEKRKATPSDMRRVASRWRDACFGNGTQFEWPRMPARGTEEHVEEASVAEVVVVTDDEASDTGERKPSRTLPPAARKEPPRRESSIRKLNPPKKRKSSVTITAPDVEVFQPLLVKVAAMDGPPAA